MAKRLVDTYQPDDRVEICFAGDGAEDWRRGRVVSLQHPGVWVRTEDGALWFVTNTRRIRRTPDLQR